MYIVHHNPANLAARSIITHVHMTQHHPAAQPLQTVSKIIKLTESDCNWHRRHWQRQWF